jgi:hypothetical protein
MRLSYVGQLRQPRGAFGAMRLSYVGQRCRSQNEPAPLCGFPSSKLVHFQMKKAPIKGAYLHLVAGARLSTYMQIKIPPFPLVAGRPLGYKADG